MGHQLLLSGSVRRMSLTASSAHLYMSSRFAEQLGFAVSAWQAWAPSRETPDSWRSWAGAGNHHGTPVSTLTSPSSRLMRRATPLGQQMVASAISCGPAARESRYVLASRHGEFARTLTILAALSADELPSPADFSMSVHNSLAGLLSIHTGNVLGHTAVAAGIDTFGFGLMEAVASLADQPDQPVLLFFGDEPLPGEFASFGEGDGELPLVLALALRIPATGDDAILFDAAPRSETHAPTNTSATDFLRFFLSGAGSVTSHGERMTWRWRRA